ESAPRAGASSKGGSPSESAGTAQPEPSGQQPRRRAQSEPASQKTTPREQSRPESQNQEKKSTVNPPASSSSQGGSQEEPGDEPQDQIVKLRGPAKAVAANMDASLTVPTATTVRAVPAKLLIDNRVVINSHLARNRGGKVSFTHLIGYAVVKALKNYPSM